MSKTPSLMNQEIPGSQENLAKRPPKDQNPAGKRGYPAPGQDKRLAAIRAREAAEAGDPEAILAELDGAETPEARKGRLGRFVEKHFADVCPPECLELGVAACLRYEENCRQLFGEPNLQLGDDDATDPELKDKIKAEVFARVTDVAANDERIAAQTAMRDDKAKTVDDQETNQIPASNGRRSELEAAHPGIPDSEAERAALLNAETARTKDLRKEVRYQRARETETLADLTTIKELQANFDRLRAEKGTFGALRSMLGPDGVKSPKMRAIVERVLATAEAIQSAVPGKPEVVTRLLDRSNLDLSGESALAVFAGFMAEAEKSEDLSEDEMTAIRETIIGIRSGRDATISDMSKSLDRTIERYDASGKLVETVPAYEGEENGLEVRDGVIIYTEHGEKVMKNLRTGQIAELDGSFGGVEHSRAIMEFWEQQNSLIDAGVERAWGWPLMKAALPNPEKLKGFQRYMQLLQGGARGLSPVVQRNREQNRFARNFLIISQRGTATPFAHSREEMEQSRAGLGLEERLDSARNEEILDAIGNFLNAPANSGLNGEALYIQLQRHLHGLFPHHVEAPGANSAISEDRAAA